MQSTCCNLREFGNFVVSVWSCSFNFVFGHFSTPLAVIKLDNKLDNSICSMSGNTSGKIIQILQLGMDTSTRADLAAIHYSTQAAFTGKQTPLFNPKRVERR